MNAVTLSKKPGKPLQLFPGQPPTPRAGGPKQIKAILLESTLVLEAILFWTLVVSLAVLLWLGLGLLDKIEMLTSPGDPAESSLGARASS